MIKAEPKISPYWSHESDPDLSNSTTESLSSFGLDPRDPGESDRIVQPGQLWREGRNWGCPGGGDRKLRGMRSFR